MYNYTNQTIKVLHFIFLSNISKDNMCVWNFRLYDKSNNCIVKVVISWIYF